MRHVISTGALEADDDGPGLSVIAAPMAHSVPCVGYVVCEAPRAGRLKIDEMTPVIDRNYDALQAAGVKDPRKLYARLKAMQPGDPAFGFPDGTTVAPADAVEPALAGRKVRRLPRLPRRCDGLVTSHPHRHTHTHTRVCF